MKTIVAATVLLGTFLISHALPLINVDYTAHLNPFLFSKTGTAVVGNNASDYWNVYSRDVTSEWDWRANGVISDLKYSDGTSSGAQLAVFNAMGAWYTSNPDPMYDSYL